MRCAGTECDLWWRAVKVFAIWDNDTGQWWYKYDGQATWNSRSGAANAWNGLMRTWSPDNKHSPPFSQQKRYVTKEVTLVAVETP